MDHNILSVISNSYPIHYYLQLAALSENKSLFPLLPYTLIILLENYLRQAMQSELADSKVLLIIEEWLKAPKINKKLLINPTMLTVKELDGISIALDLAEICEVNKKLNNHFTLPSFNTEVDVVIEDSLHSNAKNEYQHLLTWISTNFAKFNTKLLSDSFANLAKVIITENKTEQQVIYSNLIVGTNHYMTYLGGLGILALPVSSLEAKAVMFNQSIWFAIPEILGVKIPKFANHIHRSFQDLISANLTSIQVQGKIIEFYGEGLADISIEERMLIAQQIVALGAKSCFFPVDANTVNYLTAKGAKDISLIEQYTKTQGLWHDPQLEKRYIDYIVLTDVSSAEQSNNSFVIPQLIISAVQKTSSEFAIVGNKSNIAYNWNKRSSYITQSPHLASLILSGMQLHDITKARILAILGDNISTDQIIPSGNIDLTGLAGQYLNLIEQNIQSQDFDSYEARIGNYEVMLRAAFTKIDNELLDNKSDIKQQLQISIYELAQNYQSPLLLIAGKNYGNGYAKEWAAKAPALLGVRAIIAESFDPIHRANLISAGVVPLTFISGLTRYDLNLTGDEAIDLWGLEYKLTPKQKVVCSIAHKHGLVQQIDLILEAENEEEIQYLKFLGLIPYILSKLTKV